MKATPPAALIEQYCERLRYRYQPCAVAVVSIDPLEGRRPLFNLGYPGAVIDYLANDFVRIDPGYALVRSTPERFVCWDDLPSYREKRATRTVFQAVGFVQGTTRILRAGPVVGELHVNLRSHQFTAAMVEEICRNVTPLSQLLKAHQDREHLRVSPRKVEIVERDCCTYG